MILSQNKWVGGRGGGGIGLPSIWELGLIYEDMYASHIVGRCSNFFTHLVFGCRTIQMLGY